MGNHAGLTALHYAVHCDELEVVQLLLAADSDITAQAEFPDLDWGTVNAGDTVMHIAASRGSIDCIQILLRAYVSAGQAAAAAMMKVVSSTSSCSNHMPCFHY
jgi:ankyrin repeat protein